MDIQLKKQVRYSAASDSTALFNSSNSTGRAKETSRLNDYHAQLDLHGNVDGSYTISMLIL
jgi:hypothetical protein